MLLGRASSRGRARARPPQLDRAGFHARSSQKRAVQALSHLAVSRLKTRQQVGWQVLASPRQRARVAILLWTQLEAQAGWRQPDHLPEISLV